MKSARSERDVLQDMDTLSSSPGFIHVVAYFCFRDNFVHYSDNLKPEEMANLYSPSRLIRTEISTLMGYILKHPINWETPDPSTFDRYIQRSEALLQELHDALNQPLFDILRSAAKNKPDLATEDPFSAGSALREPIFYGSESAYTFQYRDLTTAKYAGDDPWLKANKGYGIEDAKTVITAVGNLTTEQLTAQLLDFPNRPPSEWTFIPAFEFKVEDISTRTGLDHSIVESVLKSFSITDDGQNQQFSELNDFNMYNAYPIIAKRDGTFNMSAAKLFA